MPVSKKRQKKPGSRQADPVASGNRRAWLLVGLGAAVLFGGAIWWMTRGDGGPVAVTVPLLTGAAAAGEKVFAANCARCHGTHAAGSKYGPPLVHRIYEPGHHGDGAFYRAAALGVRAHHWKFGNMPPVPGVSGANMRAVVAYVRALQAANGI